MSNTRSLIRQEKIVHILMEHQQITVQALAEQLGVSGWTIRRALNQLEQRSIVRRFHGGVSLNGTPPLARADFQQSAAQSLEAKRCIGLAAARLLLPYQHVVLGGGTTTTEVAKHLAGRKHLHIMTNALNIAMELAHNPDLTVTCTGGSADGDYYSLIGAVAERALQTHYFDVAVIGVSGISLEAGLTVSSQANAVVLSLMIEHSRQCIVVADHAKFGKIAFAHLAPLSRINTLVTDVRPDAAFCAALHNLRVRLLVADEPA